MSLDRLAHCLNGVGEAVKFARVFLDSNEVAVNRGAVWETLQIVLPALPEHLSVEE